VQTFYIHFRTTRGPRDDTTRTSNNRNLRGPCLGPKKTTEIRERENTSKKKDATLTKKEMACKIFFSRLFVPFGKKKKNKKKKKEKGQNPLALF
jgi:hypothetical protein